MVLTNMMEPSEFEPKTAPTEKLSMMETSNFSLVCPEGGGDRGGMGGCGVDFHALRFSVLSFNLMDRLLEEHLGECYHVYCITSKSIGGSSFLQLTRGRPVTGVVTGYTLLWAQKHMDLKDTNTIQPAALV